MSNSIAIQRWRAHQTIDRVAGAARLRYITDVPGQQAVYMVKLQQALAFVAAQAQDAGATPPPYIAAEAAAVSAAPADVAASVIALAGLWNDQVGPAIEGARMGGKAAVSAAQTPEDVALALDAALAALNAI